jgi:hypothetical protein
MATGDSIARSKKSLASSFSLHAHFFNILAGVTDAVRMLNDAWALNVDVDLMQHKNSHRVTASRARYFVGAPPTLPKSTEGF